MIIFRNNISKPKTIIINITKNKKITNVCFASNYFSRLKGLMFKKKIANVLVLKIPKNKNKSRSAIHTMFMKFPIDILFLDEEKKIFEISTLEPWKLYTPKKSASYIVELKKGSIKRYEIAIEDKLDFVYEFR